MLVRALLLGFAFSLPLSFLGLNQWGFITNIHKLSFVYYLLCSITLHVSNKMCGSVVTQDLLNSIWANALSYAISTLKFSSRYVDTFSE